MGVGLVATPWTIPVNWPPRRSMRLIGPDRSGLIDRLSSVIVQAGGYWEGTVTMTEVCMEASLRGRCAMARDRSTQPAMRTLRFLSSFRTCPTVHAGSALGSVSFSPSSCTLPCWMRRRTSEPDFGSEKIVS